MLASSTPGCVFEAAQALLQLARLQSAAPNSGCYNAVSGAAAAWAAVAVAALLQLWDRQLSTAGHAQIMDVLCQHLDCLQVGKVVCTMAAFGIAGPEQVVNTRCLCLHSLRV